MTKLTLRRIWFQCHKWIGLALALLILPICLSGAALVWHDALDRALNPSRHAVSAADPRLPITAYLAAARAVLDPQERVASIRFEAGEPVVVSAARPATAGPARGRPVRTLVWLDPGSARVLDKARSDAGFVRLMHNLHGSLLIPGMGRTVVGIVGFAMLLSALSGLWLWWPTAGRWVRGLRWRRHRDFDSNLHHLFGFWIALPLFILSLTGAWISFPALFGGRPADAAARQARLRAQPLARPAAPLEAVLAQARGPVAAVEWPTDRDGQWKVTLSGPAGPATIAVVDATGAVSAAPSAPPRSAEPMARLVRRIHDGSGMGIVWQVVIFLGGLLPAALTVTGVIMWWRARSWRGDRRSPRGAQPRA